LSLVTASVQLLPASAARGSVSCSRMNRIAVTGSVAYDTIMVFPGRFREHILPDHIEAYERGLQEAGVEHEIVTYPGAPHSFFDRKATEFSEASAGAWSEVVAFITARTAPAQAPISAQG